MHFIYKPFIHVERIDSPECDGLLNTKVSVSAKIDGTNFVAWSDVDQNIHVGSRKREITPNDDNAGAANWLINENDNEAVLLRKFIIDHPELIVYAEWMGPVNKFIGHIKSYDDAAHHKAFIFDIYDKNKERYLTDEEWRPLIHNYGLDEFTTEWFGIFNGLTMNEIEELASNNHFLLSNNEIGEGIVIKPAEPWVNKFNRIAYGKYVVEKQKNRNKNTNEKSNLEKEIVNNYLTNAELNKNIAKVESKFNVNFDLTVKSNIAMLESLCFYDSLMSEMKIIVKKFKNPIINFAKLKAECNSYIQSYLRGE